MHDADLANMNLVNTLHMIQMIQHCMHGVGLSTSNSLYRTWEMTFCVTSPSALTLIMRRSLGETGVTMIPP